MQSGYRPGHSTATALLQITYDTRYGVEKQKLTILTILDFSNAFNTVGFYILLGILRFLNISLNISVVDWFRSYLFGQDVFSTWTTTAACVPQGGVLSPLLFANFFSSISHNLSTSYHLYADDLQIYTQFSLEDLSKAVDTINADLTCISNWSKRYGLTMNPKKTQDIVIGSFRLIGKIGWSSLPPILLDCTQIPYSNKVKNLGLHLDFCMSWTSQVNKICSEPSVRESDSQFAGFFKKSLTVTAVRLWKRNSLPLHIRRAQSLHSFKSLVISYYLERY
ncbi:unnamed protein product [Parnassius mnemosyne]|uniref:Reverse transcriptase domain-containing protein n=1 Tax=Parnassius mnemosyne TaxID=213953 RepID=A0AAV1K8R4_9NEOP